MDHDFPEHYGEILLKLLDHSKEGRIYCQVWFNVLNTILAQAVPTSQTNTAKTILLPGISTDQLRDVVRRYATDQRSLSSQEVCFPCGNYFLITFSYFLYLYYPASRNITSFDYSFC